MYAVYDDDDIRPLNYCREAIKDLTKLAEDLAVVAPFSAFSIRIIIQMLKDSQKFILLNCAEFIAPEDIRQTHLDLARLPYPIVAFEAPWVKHEPVGEDPLHPMMLSTKRIALCWELDREFEPVPGCNRNDFLNLPNGGVFSVSIYWNDAEKRWAVTSGGAFYPYNNTLKKASELDDLPEGSQQAMASMIRAGRASKPSKYYAYACEPFMVLKELAEAALEAAEALELRGIEVGVVHSPVIKPLDEATILREAREAVTEGKIIITAENHSITGGLGEAIAASLMRSGVTPRFRQIALPDAFLDAGALPTLHDKYGISTAAMVTQIEQWITG